MTKDRMVWIDLEMTGLDLGSDEIVEIACIVTEADLTELDGGIDIVVKPSAAPLAAMDEFVVNMHQASGLI
ncbi:MAG: exonuclease domain-containing protein, partial [Actinomycetes bacterium]